MANPIGKNRKVFKWKYAALSKNRDEIYKRDGYRCAYCGLTVIDTRKFFDLVDARQQEEFEKVSAGKITFEEFESFNARKEIENSDAYKALMATLDHKVPLSKGGTNEEDNLVTCCISCNRKKRDDIQLENGYTKIANALLEKMAKVKMSGTCWQVLMSIVRKLYGYNKKEDWIEYSQLKEICSLPKSRISHAMKQLREYGIVTQTRKGVKQIISINKGFSVTVTQTCNSSTNAPNRYANVERTVTQTRTTKEKKETITKEIAKSPTLPEQNEINELLGLFEIVNPMINYGNKTQRGAMDRMLKRFGKAKLESVIRALPGIISKPFAPRVTTPVQLENKLGELIAFYKQDQAKTTTFSSKVGFHE